MDLDVRGKAYILVGGSRGMGLEAAKVLAADGANLAIIGRDGDHAQKQADILSSEHGIKAVGLRADASRPGEVEDAVGAALNSLGKVSGLLTTPGTTNRNGTILDMSEDDWTANFQDVFMSQVRSCKAILPHLLENGGGNLVTTSAYSSRAAKDFLFAYAALKAALNNLTKNLAKTYGKQGIRANCVVPGAVETDGLHETRLTVAKEQNLPVETALETVMIEQWGMKVALNRVGQPNELGEMMAFLLSDKAAYMTGAMVNVDGGTDF